MEASVFEDYMQEKTKPQLLALLEEAQGTVFRVAHPVLRQRQDAEDVTQEVLLELLDTLPRLADAEHCRRWLYRASLHRALDLKRSRRRRMEREQKAAAQRPESQPDISETDRDQIHQHIADLREDLQHVVVAHFFEKRTLTSLARELGVSVTQVWKRLQQGKQELARELGQRGFAAAIPVLDSFLTGIEVADPAPQLPSAVLEQVSHMSLAGGSTLLAAGGVIVATKQIVTSGAFLIGLLCFALGAGLVQFVHGSGDVDLARLGVLDEDASVEEQRDAALAHAARLQARLEVLEALEGRDDARSGAATGTGAPRIVETPEPGKGLQERLDQTLAWFLEQADAMTASRKLLAGDGPGMRAAIDRYELGMLAITKGLRDAIEADPDVFLDFLREQTDPRFVRFAVEILDERRRGGIGEWWIDLRMYRKIPAELVEGMFDLLENGSTAQRNAALDFAGHLLGIPEHQREQLGLLVSDPDPRIAAKALSAYTANLSWGQGSYSESMKKTVFDIVDNGTDPPLVAAAIYALGAIEEERAELKVLECLERGALSTTLHPLAQVLANKMRTPNPAFQERYERVLVSTLERDLRIGTFDVLTRAALRLEPGARRNVLEVAFRRAPNDRLADAIDSILTSIDQGETSVSNLVKTLGQLSDEELGRPSFPDSGKTGPAPAGD